MTKTNKEEASNLLNRTFNSEFKEENFLRFAKELFNSFAVKETNLGIWKEYKDYIESAKSFGIFRDKNNVIEVFVVKLKRTSSMERARTMQRNFIAKYLSTFEKDAALVAFYGDEPYDWRLSFIKMEYNLEKDEKGNAKIKKELTPAKRYSFLVGINEPNHTCMRQFLNLIMEEKINPSISEIEAAFSVEKVTKEFFERYKELFLRLKESLEKLKEKNKFVRKEFEERGISTVDFSKKLLGQIVFVYFLQKKGWLGVDKSKSWGTGPKDFMKKLYEKKIISWNNFFNDVLEPLFYEALAVERNNNYFSRFNCKIPFLNGGLFEPINNYDWSGTEILLENDIFGEIFNVFNLFNFTVKEDEPLEKEVAIDPEMLGKVFENLLEVKERKSKGAFYTPREIVHYMCQQSLINYLETNTDIDRKDIETFVQMSGFANAEDERNLEEIKRLQEELVNGGDVRDAEKIIKECINKLTLSNSIYLQKDKIDKLLSEIKVVDPAVGSGVFLVGIMNEIVKARSILSVFFSKEKANYELKREVIENCLYGVDTESSAVDITKLRLWLSLIVDEDNIENINALPNLDCKIMCGNSLLEEFECVKLFDERLLGEIPKDNSAEIHEIDRKIIELSKELGEVVQGKRNGDQKELEKEIRKLKSRKEELASAPKETEKQATLKDSLLRRISESSKKLRELKELQRKFFNEQNRNLKNKLKEQIDKLEWSLIEKTLNEQGNENAMKKLEDYKKNKSKPFFLWKLYFSEVFQCDNPGFDIVIANPPYVNVKQISTEEKEYFKKAYSVIGRQDLYLLFIERGLQLLKSDGIISFITSNKFLVTKNGTNLRKLILDTCVIETILDVSHCSVFKEVSVYPVVFVLQKEGNGEVRESNFLKVVKLSDENLSNSLSHISEVAKKLSQKLFYKSYEYVFDIHSSDEIRSLLVKLKQGSVLLGEIADIKLGIIAGDQKKYVISEEDYRKLTPSEKKNYKKVIGGKNVNRYSIIWAYEYILYDKNKLVGASDDKLFNALKIVIRDIALRPTASIDEAKYYCLQTLNAAKIIHKNYNPKYVLGIFNSKLMEFFYSVQYGQVHVSGGYLRYRKRYIKNFPIKRVSNNQQILIIKLVDQILAITKDKDYPDNTDKQAKVKDLEKEIDQLVYKLYELKEDEIRIVKGEK